MPTLRTQYQDPDAELEREVDFVDEIASGEVISSSVWSVTPVTVPPVAIGTPVNSFARTKALISGGVNGTTYTVRIEATCSNAEVLARSFFLRVTRQ